jgi:hypothetical protein
MPDIDIDTGPAETLYAQRTRLIIAIVTVSGFIGLATATIFMGTGKASEVLVGTILGYLSGMAKDAVSFYFGNNASTEAKDRTLGKALHTAQNGLAEKTAEKVLEAQNKVNEGTP